MSFSRQLSAQVSFIQERGSAMWRLGDFANLYRTQMFGKLSRQWEKNLSSIKVFALHQNIVDFDLNLSSTTGLDDGRYGSPQQNSAPLPPEGKLNLMPCLYTVPQ
nr:hypothetical protein CFP56_78797 [Quercus suber]